MTTPTTPTPAELFRSEMFARLDAQAQTIAAMREEVNHLAQIVESLVNGLQSAAATATAASQPAGETVAFWATVLKHNQDGKKHAYFLLGGRYAKFGVRVWPEVLPALGLAEYEKMPPDEYTLPAPINVLAEVSDYAADDGSTKRGPKKVIGRA